MPRIPDEFLETVFYLYPSAQDAENGAARGGTGFFVGIPLDTFPDRFMTYAVTNRHVIEQGNAPVIRAINRAGEQEIWDISHFHWIFDPAGNDIAVLPILIAQSIRFIVTKEFITKETLAKYDIGPGDSAFVIGRFVSHEGKIKNRPSVRFGNLAQMPFEPIQGSRPTGTFNQESFLVEVRSIPGYSGSPVYVYTEPAGIYKHRNAQVEMKPLQSYGAFLLGIDWCHLNEYVDAVDNKGTVLPYKVRANSGMMGVVPAWQIVDFLDFQLFQDQRKIEEERLKSHPETPAVSDDASGSATRENSTQKADSGA